MDYKIIKRRYQPIDIKKIEEKYSATYLGDFQIKNMQNKWADTPVAVFYQPNPPSGYSNYFGIISEFGIGKMKNYIVNASSAFSEPINAILADNGEVIYSCHRHDYVESMDGTAMVDGGKDYFRYFGKPVQIIIDNDILKVKDE